ncbi:MAG: alpha/beta hydrolase [Syntrophales bacterium]|jgi:pimeloyl-ACP methyl ester carboxylesterase|nr:alpha/beta hydrolase [Syntrophales bacterium]MCK9527277.1 alpha/beta hydrolase [Syntrophales bacterium]MDX9921253.1 alpha/beta hydrolase [Syntrophales bacterium]
MNYLLLRDDESLYYRLIDGTVTGPYLVFLHEGLGCVAMWKDFPDRLCAATGCPGLVYDRRGYGRSSPLRGPRRIHYLHDYALQELPQLLEGTIPGMPYILVGHSDGGSIALIHGAERPPLLQAIITVAAHVFVEPETLAGIEGAVLQYRSGRLRTLSAYHGDKTDSVFRAWSDTWLSPWFYPWNIEYLLRSIDCPLLVIQGADDRYGTKRQVDSITSGTTGEATAVVMERCGHTPHQEQPDETLAVLSEYIEKCL